MQLKCIVVDDSAIQRLAITKLVEDHPALDLVAEYSSALETKKGLNTHDVDLIFLDIEMPILNGFQLLDVLKNKVEVILSGKTEHAFKAFNYDAVAYLKKPLDKGFFNTAVEKAIAQVKLKQNYTESDEEYIFVKSNLKKRKVFVNDIKWVEALADYVKVVTNEQSYVVLSTMKAFEKNYQKAVFYAFINHTL